MLGLDFEDGTGKKAIEGAFFGRLLRFSMDHSLREVKFKARIPVPDSYQSIGVADEGQAGIDKDNVFTLEPGRIYGTLFCGGSQSCYLTQTTTSSLYTKDRK